MTSDHLPGPGGVPQALEQLVRTEGARVLATLIRLTGDFSVAEDAVQDAVERALMGWPGTGVPENPRAWLTLTARRRALDILRREGNRSRKEAEAMAGEPAGLPDDPEFLSGPAVDDDLLRLIFTCCHPALSVETQVALALRNLAGLSTPQVARALIVPEATMAKRLTRARQKIARAGIPYRIPPAAELPARLDGVALTLYLIYNQGYAAGVGEPDGELLRAEALRLARLLAGLMPDEPVASGLLALILLHQSRDAARRDPDGQPVLLAEQDRTAWDRSMIVEGVTLVGLALRRSPAAPDRYVVEAAISACHALAPSAGETDWAAIVSWYDVLLVVHDTPVVRLNRAAALAERDGPNTALAEMDGLAGLADYPWWHAGRAELLRRLGRLREAREALEAAERVGLEAAYVRQLATRIERPAG